MTEEIKAKVNEAFRRFGNQPVDVPAFSNVCIGYTRALYDFGIITEREVYELQWGYERQDKNNEYNKIMAEIKKRNSK